MVKQNVYFIITMTRIKYISLITLPLPLYTFYLSPTFIPLNRTLWKPKIFSGKKYQVINAIGYTATKLTSRTPILSLCNNCHGNLY